MNGKALRHEMPDQGLTNGEQGNACKKAGQGRGGLPVQQCVPHPEKRVGQAKTKQTP